MRSGDALEAGHGHHSLYGKDVRHPFHGVVRIPVADRHAGTQGTVGDPMLVGPAVTTHSATAPADSYGAQHEEFRHRAVEFQQLLWPDCAISHSAAGRILHIPGCETFSDLHVTVAGSSRPRRHGVVAHRVDRLETFEHDGLLLSSPRRLATELSSQLNGLPLLQAFEALVGPRAKGQLLTADGLRQLADSPRGFRGKYALKKVVGFVREGVRSPRETELRIVLIRSGLPEPIVSPPVQIDGGIVHPDLAYLAEMVAIEYEGDQHFSDRDQVRYDFARYAAMQAHGWTVIRVDKQLLAQPQRLTSTIRASLERRAA